MLKNIVDLNLFWRVDRSLVFFSFSELFIKTICLPPCKMSRYRAYFSSVTHSFLLQTHSNVLCRIAIAICCQLETCYQSKEMQIIALSYWLCSVPSPGWAWTETRRNLQQHHAQFESIFFHLTIIWPWCPLRWNLFSRENWPKIHYLTWKILRSHTSTNNLICDKCLLKKGLDMIRDNLIN